MIMFEISSTLSFVLFLSIVVSCMLVVFQGLMNKKAHQILLSRGRHRTSQSGSVFFVIFGVLAMLMVVSMVASDFIRGPLKTATTVNRQNVAETQLQMAAKIAAQAAVNQPGAGDCDADTFI